jgi:uncharacterized protein (TIGR03435 family)
MAATANVLGSPYGNAPMERVIDQTGLSGKFDLTVSLRGFDPKDPTFEGKYSEMRSSLLLYLSSTLEKQYGLKLERRKIPLESLIVDEANRVPSEN